jgi:hypothetical protein
MTDTVRNHHDDYGAGASDFAEWMTRKMQWQGTSPEYVAQWAREAWEAAHAAADALELRDGAYFIHDNTATPDWLRRAVQGGVYPDIDSPEPVLFDVSLSAVDWFAVAAEHPDECTVELDEPDESLSGLTMDRVQEAGTLLAAAGAAVLYWAGLVPAGPYDRPRVTVRLKGLSAVVPAGTTAPVGAVGDLLGFQPGRPMGESRKILRAGLLALDPSGELVEGTVTEWEWYSYDPSRIGTTPTEGSQS